MELVGSRLKKESYKLTLNEVDIFYTGRTLARTVTNNSRKI